LLRLTNNSGPARRDRRRLPYACRCSRTRSRSSALADRSREPVSGTKKPTPMTQLAPASLPVWLDPLTYCGCGSDRRLLSSCMSTATFASAFACWRPWCAQKSSSPELASSTRTYAWAPQRSQTSSAVSGFVGAIAPVNVAFLRVVPPAFQPSGFSFLPLQLSTTHTQASAFPTPDGVRHKRNHPQAERGPNCRHVTHGACAPPVLGGSTGGTQAPCASN